MAAKKTRGLGRGLDALFGDVEVNLSVKEDDRAEEAAKQENGDPAKSAESSENETTRVENGISYIDINDIKPNLSQPRKNFDEEKLRELASSIEEHGLIQPVVLRKAKVGYEIVAGERRWRAARLIGIKELPCIVKDLTDEENMQREDLNPIEEAEGISQMMDTYGLTQEEVSKSLGKSRPYITNSLRLLKLNTGVKGYVSDGTLSAGHARALAAISDEEKQRELAEIAVREGLSVRQIEKLARENKETRGRKSTRSKSKSPDVMRVEEDLKEILGTKVNLNQRGKKGKIEIEFYSREDLDRLIELLKTLS